MAFFATASGLMMERVRSIAIQISRMSAMWSENG
jgi:hypothetical protein